MTPLRTSNVTSGAGTSMPPPLLLVEGEVKLAAESPERVIEEIQVRATLVSSVLENILLEPHGHANWGINE